MCCPPWQYSRIFSRLNAAESYLKHPFTERPLKSWHLACVDLMVEWYIGLRDAKGNEAFMLKCVKEKRTE
jgi:hypothetical protein